jgi:hypothetical protein
VQTICVLLACLAAMLLAVDRYDAYAEANSDLEAVLRSLARARALRGDQPGAFLVEHEHGAGKEGLKSLVQTCGTNLGLGLAYLSETEREAGKGIWERQVHCRLVGVPHEKLVAFLTSLEAAGHGAKLKEIRLKPAKDSGSVYEEAEALVAVRWLAPEALRGGQ